MTTSYLNIGRNGRSEEAVIADGWVNVEATSSAINLTSTSDNQLNGLSVTFLESSFSVIGVGSSLSGQGAASWVPVNGLHGGLKAFSTTVWTIIRFSGLDNAKDYNLQFAGSTPNAGRTLEFRTVGGSTQVLECYDSAEAAASRIGAVLLSGVTPSGGVIDIEWKSGSGGDGYLSALGISEAQMLPTVTTTDTLQPGTEFTLTATNYASAPVSPATLTDSEGSTITVPVTISGSGPYTAVGTMPTLAEAVTAGTSLLFGDVTIELST